MPNKWTSGRLNLIRATKYIRRQKLVPFVVCVWQSTDAHTHTLHTLSAHHSVCSLYRLNICSQTHRGLEWTPTLSARQRIFLFSTPVYLHTRHWELDSSVTLGSTLGFRVTLDYNKRCYIALKLQSYRSLDWAKREDSLDANLCVVRIWSLLVNSGDIPTSGAIKWIVSHTPRLNCMKET